MANNPAIQVLLDEIEVNFARMPESIFREFIPFFFERNTLSEEEVTALRKRWIELAIDPRLSVNVMSEDGKQFLFRVPPLMYTTQELTGNNIVGLVMEWIKHNEVSVRHGDMFARKHVRADMLFGEMTDADKVAWMEIMHRYNYVNMSGSSSEVVIEDDDEW